VNILSLTSSYPRYDGDPTAPFVESITKRVAARGHRVDLVLPESNKWQRAASDGDVHYHVYRYTPFRSWTPWGFSESLERGVKIKAPLYALAPLVFASAQRAAGAVLAVRRIDVVHAHWLIPNGPIAARVARSHGLPLVLSLHGSDVSVSERVRAIGRVARRTLSQASAVTAPSADLLERAHRLGATGDLCLIPYGADVDALTATQDAAERLRARLGLTRDRVVVVGIGRFVSVKGFPYLIDAVAQARSTCPELHLVLVGDGDLRTDLAARARAQGVFEHTSFPGMVDRSEVADYLALADLVVVPSINFEGLVDGLPNVALEAMAAGKPLVATRVGGLPDLVRDEGNGLLVEEKDSGALAGAVVRLARDPRLRTELGASARQEIRTARSWDHVAAQYVDVFERAIAGG